jgi:tetratricopeptide (TPR) repeat protein
MLDFLRCTAPACLIALLILSCTNNQPAQSVDDLDQEARLFLGSKFDDLVAEGIHYKRPGYCFRQIQKQVPQKWWRYATEGLYYRLPETEYHNLRQWMDTAQVILVDKNVLSFLHMIRGITLSQEARYDTAIALYRESYALAMEYNQPYRANDAKRYMARCLMLKGDYPGATALLMQVNAFFEDKSDFFHQVRKYETLLELARVCQISGDKKMALYWSRQAWEYSLKNSGQEVEAAEYLAQSLLDMNLPDSAWLMIQEAEMNRSKLHITVDSARGHFLMGKTLTERRQYSNALPRLQMALSGNLETKNRLKIGEIETALADCYRGMGQTDRALQYYLNALNTTPDTSRMSSLHYSISDIYEKKGALADALYHVRLGAQYFRIFFNAEKDRTIGRMEVQAALERQESQVKFLTEQQKKQQFKTALMLLVLLSGITTLLLLLDRQRRRRIILETEKELLEARQLIQQQELQIANASLSEKTAEVESLQNLLDLKNQLISSLEQKINSPETDNIIEQPLRMLTNQDWRDFREKFEKQFPGYIGRLKNSFPEITNVELRLFIFIKIGLENTDIANISGISAESLYSSRYRLRKKLNLDPDANLEWFVRDF